MKVWLISLACLCAFLSGAYLVQISLDQTAIGLDQQLNEVEARLAAHDWEASLSKLNTVRKNWEKIKPYWAVLINHKEMDLIEAALIKTIKATSSKSFADAQIYLGALRDSVKHIPEKERFSLVNIF